MHTGLAPPEVGAARARRWGSLSEELRAFARAEELALRVERSFEAEESDRREVVTRRTPPCIVAIFAERIGLLSAGPVTSWSSVGASPQARVIVAFLSTRFTPTNAMQAFACDEDDSFGITPPSLPGASLGAPGGKLPW